VIGTAVAGGCEICLACDIIVASDETKFGLPEPQRGLMAGAGGVTRLPRAIPRHVALEMVATGDPIDAQRAHTLGLANRVAPASQVLEEALKIATRIAGNAPLAVQESLKLARASAFLSEAELKVETDAGLARLRDTEDFKEGPKAFVEKRAPVWKGR
jgi:enoyl-CoA hydratase/carnithine racemase